MSHEPLIVVCPKCRGTAQDVSANKIYPERPLTLERIWWCARCEIYSPMDRDRKPLGTLADKELWNARALVKDRLLSTRIAPQVLAKRLGMAPWSFQIDTFTMEVCEEAMDEMTGNSDLCKTPEVEAHELLS